MYDRTEYDIVFDIDNILMRMGLETLTNKEESSIRELNDTKNIDVDKLWEEMENADFSTNYLLQDVLVGSVIHMDYTKALAFSLRKTIDRTVYLEILVQRVRANSQTRGGSGL